MDDVVYRRLGASGIEYSKETAPETMRAKLVALRAPARAPEDLAPLTFKWLARLPTDQRPQALPRAFPRIANRIAYLWPNRPQCEQYLDDLVMDQRGDRRGFPTAVARELAMLRMFYARRRINRLALQTTITDWRG